jgi:O-antigen/teichoic acid export membrane protein
MSIKKRLPAGVLDSSFASAATFAIGVYAVRYLDAAALGIYSLFFSTFMMASVVPSSLIFTSARVRLLSLPAPQRLRAYPQTLRLGFPTSLVAALLVGIAIPQALSTGHEEFVVPMTLTAFFAAALSPLQDHIRGLLHLGGASWGAALVSAVQATIVAIVVGAAILGGVPAAWVPFGGLVAANGVSLCVGMVIGRVVGERPPPHLFTFRDVGRSGAWFLTMNLISRASDFLGRTAVIAVAAADVLGVAEGARVAARPLAVFVLGVSAVITPRSMEVGKHGDRNAGRRIARLSNLGVFVLALVYLLLGGIDWQWNLMARLAPIGYTVAGLVPATIAATALQGMLFAERGELIGGGREKQLTAIELVSAGGFALCGLLAGIIGPFVIPLGMAVASLAYLIGYKIALRRHYRDMSVAANTERPRTEATVEP